MLNIDYSKAVDLTRAGKYKKANKLCRKLLKLDPENFEFQYLQGIIFLGMRNFQNASVFFERCSKIDTGNAEILGFLSEAYKSSERYEDAENCLRKLIELTPFDSLALINFAHISQELRKPEEGIRVIKEKLDFHQSVPDVYMTYGNLLMETRSYAEAIIAFQKVIELKPDSIPAHMSLAGAFAGLKNIAELIIILEKCLEFEPGNIGLINRLGRAHYENFNFKTAINYIEQSLEIDSSQSGIYAMLGNCFSAIQEDKKAINAFQICLKLNPDDKSSLHRMNALKGVTTDVIPLQYVSNLFDEFADRFETILIDDLGYDVPRLLRKEIDEIMEELPIERYKNVLDLGGGTGLVAKEIRDIAEKIHNVDISVEMVRISREANRYDAEFVDDIISFLNQVDMGLPFYELILAADTCIYFGDLEQICSAVFGRLQPGGFFVFNVESMNAGNFKIQTNGRYFHSKDYLNKIATDTGFILYRIRDIVARQENKKDLNGFIASMQKPAD